MCFGPQRLYVRFVLVHNSVALQKIKIRPQRLYSMPIGRQCTPAVPSVEGSCVSRGKTSIEFSAERHNSRIRIHAAWLYRYSSK